MILRQMMVIAMMAEADFAQTRDVALKKDVVLDVMKLEACLAQIADVVLDIVVSAMQAEACSAQIVDVAWA